MDNYTKYGLLAAGAIGLYLATKKGGLSDEVRDDSYEELSRNDASLMGFKKRRGNNGYSGRYLNLSWNEDSLKITLTKEGREELTDYPKTSFYDLFEDIQGNSEIMYIDDAADIGFGLTNAPVILISGYERNDDGDIVEYGDEQLSYYYADYQIQDPVKKLKKGSVTFDRAESYGVKDRMSKKRRSRKSSSRKSRKK